MNVVMIHGVAHKGSTYHITQLLLKHLSSSHLTVTEFFLPLDMNQFCTGCTLCFKKDETQCPHYNQIKPITNAMDQADLLIFNSPVYVYHITGQMKAFLDHYGHRFMIHRPNGAMFHKTAVIISTAAGGGMKSTNKDIKDSLTYWGVGKIHSYGKAIFSTKWKDVTNKRKDQIDKDIKHLANKISRNYLMVRPSLHVKLLFYMMRFMHKKFEISKIDHEYWNDKGWLEKTRPWKS